MGLGNRTCGILLLERIQVLRPPCERGMWMFPEGQKAVSKRQPKECWVRDTKHGQEAEKCVASEHMLNHLFHEKASPMTQHY